MQTFLLPQQSFVCDMYPKVTPEEKSNNSIVVILQMRHMGPWLKSEKIRKTALKSEKLFNDTSAILTVFTVFF